MRYVVPITDGRVSAHFGRCSHFALFDVDESAMSVVNRQVILSPGHEPGLLPSWLAEQGVSVVIASGMGSRAQALFNESGIEVLISVRGDDPEKAVLDCVKGELATGGNICDH
ncbi:MAG: NifB/NifX family molybdenum-iron cluster-binding protein [Dehalococcoidia bacterium]